MRTNRLTHRLSLLLFGLLLASPMATLAGEVTYYYTDASGSPIAATDAVGTVIWHEHYAPYGEKLNEVCPMPCDDLSDYEDIGYTGHEYDAETGLTYMQARYYDPEVGRFLAIDPVGFKPTQPMTFNRYTYANNNPYKFHDPDGRIVDTIVDVGFIIYDVYKIATEGATTTNMAALGADGLSLLVPFATGGGLAVRASAKIANVAGDAASAAKRSDFIATSDGAVVANSPDKLRASLEGAGFSSKKIQNPSGTETGTSHNIPGMNMDVRVMNGGPNHPPRAVTTRQGTSQPVNPTNGSNFGNVSKAEQRNRSHITLEGE